MRRSVLAAAGVALGLALASCGGSSGGTPSVCGGDLSSTPVLCDLVVVPGQVETGGTFALEFGLADREGDITAAAVGVEQAGELRIAWRFEIEPLGGQANDFFRLEVGLTLHGEDGEPLPPGDYRVLFVVGDATGRVSNEAAAPLRILWTGPGPAPSPTPTPTPPTLGSSNIFYTGQRDGLGSEVCVTNLEGLAPTCVTHSTGSDSGPAVSADGTTVAFVSNRTGRTELYVMNADGTGQRRLTFGAGNIYRYALSPRGDLIAWEEGTDVHLMRTDRTGYRRVTSDGFNGHPLFTLDGAGLIFMRMPPGGVGDGLHLLDLRTGEVRRLAPEGMRGTSVHLLSDGETMLFMPGYYNDRRVFSMRLDGSDLRQVAELPYLAEWLVASPDGRTLAFLEGGYGWRDIALMDVATGLVRKLTDDREHDEHSHAFSPDGSRLVFASDRAGSYDLYTVDLDGSNLERLTDDPASESSPVWR